MIIAIIGIKNDNANNKDVEINPIMSPADSNTMNTTESAVKNKEEMKNHELVPNRP